MNTRTRVYIAGPLRSSGTVENNIASAVNVARKLVGYGFAPLCPHLGVYIDPHQDYGHRRWMEIDLSWVEVSDVVLRLPGESVGADEEVEYAHQRGIPVFYDVESLLESVSRFQEQKENDDTSTGSPDVMTPLHALELMHEAITGHEPHEHSRSFYRKIIDAAETHACKNADYGRVDRPFSNIESSVKWGVPAWVGALVRANDKVARLQTAAQGNELKNESIEDSLRDLANYALIAWVLLESEQESVNDAGWHYGVDYATDPPTVVATKIDEDGVGSIRYCGPWNETLTNV